MLAIVSIEKNVITNICEKNYAEILFASSDIPEHVNMEQNVDFCKDSVVFITTKPQNKIKESATLEKEIKELKSDVSTLTKVLEDKEQKLQELSEMIANQNEKILELKAENSKLKSNWDNRYLIVKSVNLFQKRKMIR